VDFWDVRWNSKEVKTQQKCDFHIYMLRIFLYNNKKFYFFLKTIDLPLCGRFILTSQTSKNTKERIVCMRINKVEELVGITKKNIRFYEEQGLLSPARNLENGYRDYSEEDVETLHKIKLLRQLSVPIEEILKLQKGILTLEDCMRRHIITLNREEENVRQNKIVCEQLETCGEQFSTLDTEKYLLLMKDMEKEGVRFMNVEHVDKRRRAPIIATIVMVVLMAGVIGLLCWAAVEDPIPLPFLCLIIAFPVAVIGGVILALKQRIKEIDGGEEDAASKY